MPKVKKFYPIEENKHPYRAMGEKDARVERSGSTVHVYMTTIRSHFAPDNIEGIKVGDKVYFHVTNLEQDWDVPHVKNGIREYPLETASRCHSEKARNAIHLATSR